MQFQRITTQKRFIPQIDGLRFVAIASVVFFHIHYALVRDAHVVSGLAAPVQALNNDLAKRGVELFLESADSFWEFRLPHVICSMLPKSA